MNDDIADAFIAPNGDFNTAQAIEGISHAIQRLGLADASTHFGAIESLGMAITEAATMIARALDGISDAIHLQGPYVAARPTPREEPAE